MKFISFIILLFISLIATAQEVEFKATAPSVVEMGEKFRLSYSVNKEGSDLRVPTLDGFDLLMGPSSSQSTSISVINGRTTQRVSFSYTYLMIGVKEGIYQIPPATIVVDGKQYSSNALKIQVVKGRGNGNNSSQGNQAVHSDGSAAINDENLFVKVDLSRHSLYMGESLVAVIKVYSRVDLSNLGRSKFPPFDGFLAEEIPIGDRVELVRENYNGQVYNVGIIRKVLLFPQHTGEITIAPFELECIVRQGSAGGRSLIDDFFVNYRDIRVMRKSRPIKIQVRSLPQEGKPLGFSGTVGDITMNTSISTDTVSANDALTYKITFSGTGNLKLLKAPTINFPHDFEVYDPKEVRDIKTGENGMYGTVTFEYLAIPRYSGDYQIPAVNYSYFNSQTRNYRILSGQDYNIHVKKGAEKGTGDSPAIQFFKKEDVRKVGEDIRYIKAGDLKLHPKGVRFFGTLGYWLSFIVPFVLFVVGALLNRRRIKTNADLVKVKNRAASKMAQKRMKVAAGAMRIHNAELFYDEVLKALWGYMSYKLNIDRAELNRDNISDILQKKSVDTVMVQEFIGVLDTCEYARYAPDSNSEQEMGKIYQDGVSVITKLDKVIK